MEDSKKKNNVEGRGDKEILYSRTIKAGKRIYYLDVKKNQKGDMFVAITESKKVQEQNSSNFTFEKHKIFLYPEDFGKFLTSMEDIINYVKLQKKTISTIKTNPKEILPEEHPDDIKLDIDFDTDDLKK